MVVCHHLQPWLQAMWANLTSLVQQLLQQTVMEGEEALSASLTMAGALADTASTMLQPSSLESSSSNGAGGGSCVDGSDGSVQETGQTGSLGTAVQMLEFAVQLLDHAKQQAGELAPLQQEQQGQLETEEGSAGLSQQVADIQQQVGSGCTPRRCCMRPAPRPCSASVLSDCHRCVSHRRKRQHACPAALRVQQPRRSHALSCTGAYAARTSLPGQ